MAELKLSGVRKAYGATTVLHGIDLDVADGEFVVFVGPSGCGKSTLLRSIAGLEEITGGTIAIDGTDATHLPASERGLAMVFQSYALYPHMSVYANMAFALENMGFKRDEIEKRVKRAAGMLRLTDYLDRKPKALSGGQRQRVAIGRAIVREPAAFLFDEPLPNLDAALRVTMRHEITGRHQKLKTTMIYVTHDQVEAMTMADKIVLHAGRIEQVGSPLELYNAPANIFVAGFHWQPEDEPRHRSRGGETRCPYHRRPPRASGDRGRGRLAGQGASGRASGLGHLPQGGQSRAGRADRPRQRRVRAESW